MRSGASSSAATRATRCARPDARPARERATLEEDLAPRGGEEARERAHQRRLAGRVRPDEGEGLARLQREVDAPQHASGGRGRRRARGPRGRRSPAPSCPAQREQEVGRADERGDGAEGQLDVLRRRTARRGRPPPRGRRPRGTRPAAGGGRAAPRARRSAWGATRPTNGTAPATAVTGPATSAHRPKTRMRTPWTGRLSAAASSSPRESTSSGRARSSRASDAGQHERGGEGEVLVAAALEAAGQPEEHGAHAELLGGHEQDRGAGGGEGAHREAGQQQARERGPSRRRGRSRRSRRSARSAPAHAASGQGEEALLRPAEVHGEHRAEGGTGPDAEEAGVGQRVAEERLQRGAHDREAAAHERRDQDARRGGPTTG